MTGATQDMVARSPLLATKLFAPKRRPGLVPRRQVLDRLDRGAGSKLILVSAPPGFGKTTLLADWLATAAGDGRAVAWLSLDAGDNRPATFWTYMITALQGVRPGVGESALAMLESAEPPAYEALLAGVLNDLAASSREVLLVLDDYHVVEATAVHDGVAFLLDHLPPQMHLVVASRADPPLPLSRLRARGELTEVRAADLRFSAQEAGAFLNGAMGLRLSEQEVAALESRTEGWIAALQLAALSMQGRPDPGGFIRTFAGDDRYLVDYLVEEVLQRQPAAVRDFLLQTSVLDRLSGPLCDAVTVGHGGKAMLETLERANLFVVPLDDRRQWYRYHHLFADVLQAHLAAADPGLGRALHRRASDWYAADGQTTRAVHHALAAGEAARAADLVEQAAEQTVRAHRLAQLVEWLRPVPDSLVRSMPVLSTYYAMALQGTGAIDAAEARLRDAERWLDDAASHAGDAPARMRAALQELRPRAWLARGYQSMARGDTEGTAKAARHALGLLSPDEHYWFGTAALLLSRAQWAAGDLRSAEESDRRALASLERAGGIVRAAAAAYFSGEVLKSRGRLRDARRHYERWIGLTTAHGHGAAPAVANLHFGLSELYAEQDDLDGAVEHLQRGEAVSNTAALPATAYRRCLAQARVQRNRGDLAGALGLLEQAAAVYVPGAVPDARPVAALRARLLVQLGRLSEAQEWARAEKLSVDERPTYAREFELTTLARLALAEAAAGGDGRAHDAVGLLLDRVVEAAEAGGRTATVVEALALRALVDQAQGGLPAALGSIGRALALAGPEGYMRTFVDEGTAMRGLLRQAVAAGVGGDYARRLVAASGTPAGEAGGRRAVSGLAEQLTPREAEILRLLAAGLRNQEIADQLVISLPTVKRHIANTYGKLGVGHRTQAIVRARGLGLLPG